MGTRVLRPFNVLLYNENTTKTCFQKCKKVPARPPPDCDAEQKKSARKNLQRLRRPHTSCGAPEHHNIGAARFLHALFKWEEFEALEGIFTFGILFEVLTQLVTSMSQVLPVF